MSEIFAMHRLADEMRRTRRDRAASLSRTLLESAGRYHAGTQVTQLGRPVPEKHANERAMSMTSWSSDRERPSCVT
jgi:hypothetical protein